MFGNQFENPRFGRRAAIRLLGRVLLAPVAVQLSVLETPQAQASEIKVILSEFEPARGRQSLPWLPADPLVEGLEATGLYEGGPWDKYDALDRRLNGNLARSVRWDLTRAWILRSVRSALERNGGASRAWTGHCQDAAVSSFYSPIIEGSINLLGIHFSESDRQVIGALTYGGLLRRPNYQTITPEIIGDLTNRALRSECVVVNRSEIPGQDWWGLVTGVDEGGSFIITKPRRWYERGLQVEVKHPTNLWAAAVMNDVNFAQLGREGNFQYCNQQYPDQRVSGRAVAGLIIGTHQLSTS